VAEPSELPFSELPAPRPNQFDRIGQVDFAVEVVADLAVAECLRRLPAHRSRQCTEATNLLDPAGGDHGINATVDAVVQLGAAAG